MSLSNQFADFEHAAEELNKYHATADFVTLMLKSGRIIHHSPVDLQAFLQWLDEHKIQNIKQNDQKQA